MVNRQMSNGQLDSLTFELNIEPEQYRLYYAGAAKTVVVRSLEGKVVRFPANVLQRHLTHDGIHGCYRLRFNSDNKFVDIEKID